MNEPENQLLAAARLAAEPSEADRARVRAALAATLAAGAAASVAPVVARSGLFAGSTAKLAVVLVLVGVGGGIFWLSRPAPEPPLVAVHARVVPPAVAPAAPPSITPPAVDPPAVAPAAPPAAPPVRPRAAKLTPAVAPAPAAPPAPADLAGELAALTRARNALRAGDASAALAALAEHERDFPAAQLREEATALRVRALCAAGHGDEARTLAREFLRTWPSSPQAPGVRSTCPSDDDDDKESP
jgi:hypothetical protein